jgi:hypothetical protein
VRLKIAYLVALCASAAKTIIFSGTFLNAAKNTYF